MTLAQELRPLDSMNNLRLLLTCKTLSHELMVLDDMNNIGLLTIEMNDSGS